MVGLLENVDDALTIFYKNEGDNILLVGEYGYNVGGSEYLQSVFNQVAGDIPDVDLNVEKNLIDFLQASAKEKMINSAHDISEGGLVCALAEKGIGSKLGCDVNISLPNHREDFVLFNEDQSRVIVTTSDENIEKVMELTAKYNLPVYMLGKVVKNDFNVSINDKSIEMEISEVEKLWREALSCKMAQQKIN
jgi:phosphoribosylformylglycinamidine synthase